MTFRTSIKVYKSWNDGAFKRLATKFKEGIPDKIRERTAELIENRAKTYAPYSSGRLRNALRARVEDKDIIVSAEGADYFLAQEKGFKGHFIPLQWWGKQSSESRSIEDARGFVYVEGSGERFVERAINDARLDLKEISVDVIKDTISEVF